MKWKSFTTGEDKSIEWTPGKDKAIARLDDGKAGEIILKRQEGNTSDPIVIKNLKYWGTPRNEGFVLMKNEVDLDSDPLTCIITAAQHDNLLSDTNIISTDFNEKPVLVDGKVTRFLGINFVHCERIPLLDSDTRRVPIFPKSAMYLGIWNDIKASVSTRNDLQGEPWQAYCSGTFGATRLEEKRMVEVLCLET